MTHITSKLRHRANLSRKLLRRYAGLNAYKSRVRRASTMTDEEHEIQINRARDTFYAIMKEAK